MPKAPSVIKPASTVIRESAALAYFATAYADLMEELGTPLSGEILDQLPSEVDPAARLAADQAIMQFLAQFEFDDPTLTENQRLAAAFMKASNVQEAAKRKGDRELTPDLFGHYLAMQAMGTGVGLESFGQDVHDALPVPLVEFSCWELSGDYGQLDREHCISCGNLLEEGQIGQCDNCQE